MNLSCTVAIFLAQIMSSSLLSQSNFLKRSLPTLSFQWSNSCHSGCTVSVQRWCELPNKGVVGWSQPAAEPPPSHTLTAPQWNGNGKSEKKLMGWVEDSLISEGKRGRGGKKVMQSQSLATSHQHADAPWVSKQGLVYRKSVIHAQQFYCWTWCYTAWSIPLVGSGQLFWLCPSQPLVHP